MRSQLAERVLCWIQDQGVPRAGQRVGVAVSAGADSVALLLLLLELREKLGIVLHVVHFNHKLRGKAADADERFVERLAAKYGLEFHAAHMEIAAKAKLEKANLENVARRERLVYFERLVREGDVDVVAVAHTADDQAETVLMHLLRGTGIAGLSGIRPVLGPIVRPLLGIRRAELRAYLRAKKQIWREDATNRDIRRFRARIRRKLLPLLEKEYQPAIVERLGTLAERARQDSAFLAAATEKALKKATESASRVEMRVEWLLKPLDLEQDYGIRETRRAEQKDLGERALKSLVVKKVIGQIKSGPSELSSQHVEAVIRLAQQGKNGSSLDLPGVRVRRERDVLVFESSTVGIAAAGGRREFEYALDSLRASLEIRVPQLGCVFRFKAIDWPEKTGDTRYTGSALDRDALRSPLVLRNWRPGDKLHPIGHRNAHKLKRLLNKKRIGRWDRDGWPVLTSGGVLAWARGFPVAAEFAATERTRAGIVIVEEALS